MGTTPYSFMKSCRLFAAIRALAVFIQRRTTFRAKAGFGAGRCFGFDRGADRLGCRLCRSSFSTTGFAGAFFTGASEAVSVGTVFLTGAVFTGVSVSAFHRRCFRSRFCCGLCCRSRFSAAGFVAGAAFFTAGLAGAGVGEGFFGSRLINSGSAVFGFLSTVF